MGGGVSEASRDLSPFSLPPTVLYAVLFLAGLVETAFPPFPGDALTVAASVTLARQNGAVAVGLALSCAGSYLGGLVLWVFGTQWSMRSPRVLARYAGSGGMERAQRLLARHGVLLVILSRFIPGIRSFILIAAGIAHMPLRRVAWALGLAVTLWQSLIVVGGYVAGRNWLRVVSVWSKVGVVLLGMLIGYVCWRRVRATSAGGVDDRG